VKAAGQHRGILTQRRKLTLTDKLTAKLHAWRKKLLRKNLLPLHDRNPRRAHCQEAGAVQPEEFAGQMLETLLIFRVA
jgi:hypothetical protein